MATRTLPMRRADEIDLEPTEADILSFVAAQADRPAAKPELMKALSTSTKRAQAIGAAILDPTTSTKPVYKVIAERFRDASASNQKNARILKWSSSQRGNGR